VQPALLKVGEVRGAVLAGVEHHRGRRSGTPVPSIVAVAGVNKLA